MKKVTYSANIDYLVATIFYLSSNKYWWGRSPTEMASELSLDRDRLLGVFDGFPGIFRKSRKQNDAGECYYSLQARYALRGQKGAEELSDDSIIAPLSDDRVEMLLNFILHAATEEKRARTNRWANIVAVSAAVISAAAAVFASLAI